MTEYENSNTINRLFIKYTIDCSRTVIAMGKSSAATKFGDIIIQNNIQYGVVNTKYDCELGLLTVDYHYTVNIVQIN